MRGIEFAEEGGGGGEGVPPRSASIEFLRGSLESQDGNSIDFLLARVLARESAPVLSSLRVKLKMSNAKV